MREILESLERWSAEGQRAALATLVATERSALRAPGATMAVSERGDVAGSLTGGCVEPALYEEARAVLAGEPARLVTYGIADDEAFEAGLPCGGTIHVLVAQADLHLVGELATALREERPVALALKTAGDEIGAQELGPANGRAQPALEGDTFVLPLLPRPRLYVFGSVEHAGALAEAGRLLGYHVTICDARAKFLTAERFPRADELVVGWPDEVLGSAKVDARTAICVLTHDKKFDVPALKAALATDAGYIGALGSKKTNAARADRLREEGISDEEIGRIHAPIGLDIGAKTPQEVAIAIAAEIVALRRASGST
jgi:xanthine dehydrogenase accessory factor